MSALIKQYYVIIGFVTSEEDGYYTIYDSNRRTDAYNWPTDKAKQFQFLTYQEAYKRFQEVYAFNREHLDKYSFMLRLETFKYEGEIIKTADERADELFNHFAKSK